MAYIKSEPGLNIFFGALIAGIAGKLLFTSDGWGLGVTLWVLGLGAIGMFLKKGWTLPVKNYNRLLLFLLGALAVCFGWRDALFLKIATSIASITVFTLMMQANQLTFLKESKNRHPGLSITGFQSFFGFLKYLRKDVDWSKHGLSVDKNTANSVFRALVIAVPFLTLFGVLLSSADENFSGLMQSLFDIEFYHLPGKLLTILGFTVIAGTFLYGLIARLEEKKIIKEEKKTGLGMLEVGIVLGLINLMFCAFVVLQMGYLFGGIGYIDADGGITLKHYTRKGFFELVTVAAISLPLLMGMKRFFKPASKGHTVQFNALAGAQIGLLVIMLISATQRMWLYVNAFGITELRLYSSVFMLWLAFVLIWFGVTSLQGNGLNFVRGSALAGVIMVVCLNVINPDKLIVQNNLNRAIKGVENDGNSLRNFSADAIPAALDALPNLPAHEYQMVFDRLSYFQSNQVIQGWRDWNYSQHMAKSKVNEVWTQNMIGNSSWRTPIRKFVP